MNEYIMELMTKDERVDGRKLDEYRKIEIETDVIERAEGSARVKIGKTDVLVGVKMELNEPFPDMKNMGILRTDAELTPIASPEFFPGPPGEDAIELGRVVDRGIRESEAIDLEKLCIVEGEKVWGVCIDIRIINHDGNLIDAASLGAIAALSTTKIPKIDKDYNIDRENFSGKLPLVHKPLAISIGKVDGKYIVDTQLAEEKLLESRVMVTIREDGKVNAMQKNKKPLNVDDINNAIDLAVKKTKELRKLV